jgi:UPF0271 protein
LLSRARPPCLRGIIEAFADRAYNADGTLVSRHQPGAMFKDPQTIADNMVRLVREGVLVAHGGQHLKTEAGSICVHGDTPDSVATAAAVCHTLQDAGIQITNFA